MAKEKVMTRIKAVYIEDEREFMEFDVTLNSDGRIDENQSITGFAKEEYTTWRFTVTPDDGETAFIEWEDCPDWLTTIELMNKRIYIGMEFTRFDHKHGKSVYKVVSILKI